VEARGLWLDARLEVASLISWSTLVDARATIAAEGGAVLDLNQGPSYLAAAAHDIFLFEPAR
jgi:hypothetical protein